jgi:hypothetical protein
MRITTALPKLFNQTMYFFKAIKVKSFVFTIKNNYFKAFNPKFFGRKKILHVQKVMFSNQNIGILIVTASVRIKKFTILKGNLKC